MAGYTIRTYGDPVLRQKAAEITDIDGAVAQLAEDMLAPMRSVRGLGLAAPQVGVLKRMFVYELPDDTSGPKCIVNPVIAESRGEWEYEEGCLSVPELYFPIVRPKEVHITGFDLDGNEMSIEADELLGRLFQHELDHLDGVLLLEHLDESTRKKALKELRKRQLKDLPLD
jgi:peptide deformylase